MKLTSLFRVPMLSLSVLAAALFASPVRSDVIMIWNMTADARKAISKAKGIELGREAAVQMLASRASDGSDARESYRYVTQPGVYVPTAIVASSTVGGRTPSGHAPRLAAAASATAHTSVRDVDARRQRNPRSGFTPTARSARPSRPTSDASGSSPVPRTYNPDRPAGRRWPRRFDIVDNAAPLRAGRRWPGRTRTSPSSTQSTTTTSGGR